MRSTARRPLVLGLAAVVAIAAPLLLSGCSLIPHGDGGGISLPGVSVGSGKLPKDFPSEVPVAKGEILTGASLGGDAAKGKVWNVTIKVDGQGTADDIKSQLTGAGFEGGDLGTGDGSTGATYHKDHYTVLVLVTKSDKNGWVANYTITYDPKSEG